MCDEDLYLDARRVEREVASVRWEMVMWRSRVERGGGGCEGRSVDEDVAPHVARGVVSTVISTIAYNAARTRACPCGL